jgi:diaminopimelate epimerase
MRFEGVAGIIEAVVSGEQVTVRAPEPTGVRFNVRVPLSHSSAALPPGQVGAGGASAGPPPGQIVIEGHAINTGVPHFVHFVPNVATAEVIWIGRPIRYHDAFKPDGTNVSFVQVVDQHTLHVRTYERGVEEETLACGSGAIASALLAAAVQKVESPVTVVPLSQMPLTVTFRMKGDQPEAGFVDVTLTGNALAVYEGLMRPAAWEDGRL